MGRGKGGRVGAEYMTSKKHEEKEGEKIANNRKRRKKEKKENQTVK